MEYLTFRAGVTPYQVLFYTMTDGITCVYVGEAVMANCAFMSMVIRPAKMVM